jgi:integrase
MQERSELVENLSRAKHLAPLATFPVDRGGGNRALYRPAQATTGVSVRTWGAAWLERREREGVRSVKDDRTRWRVHVESEPWADLPLSEVTREIARAWWTSVLEKGSSNPTHKSSRRSRRLAGTTLSNVRQVVRRCFADAKDEGLIETNPFDALKVPRSRRARTRQRPVLFPHEQGPALALFDGWQLWLVEAAMYSGIRQREQWALRLEDVDVTSSTPSILVRFGSVSLRKPAGGAPFEKIDGAYFEPTKNGTPRRVQLNPRALSAMRAWLKHLSDYAPHNPHGLVFPCADGSPRKRGRVFRGFSRISKLIGRPFTWHGLRHTCASSLVGAWWGVQWDPFAVKDHMGHSSIEVTQQYVTIAASALVELAAGTSGPPQAIREHGETMVDANGIGHVESAASSSEDAGHLSSAVEQRFRNTKAEEERDDARRERDEARADLARIDRERERDAQRHADSIDAVRKRAERAERERDASRAAVEAIDGNLIEARGELALARAAVADAKRERDEAREVMHSALNAPGEARRILEAGTAESLPAAALRVIKERDDARAVAINASDALEKANARVEALERLCVSLEQRVRGAVHGSPVAPVNAYARTAHRLFQQGDVVAVLAKARRGVPYGCMPQGDVIGVDELGCVKVGFSGLNGSRTYAQFRADELERTSVRADETCRECFALTSRGGHLAGCSRDPFTPANAPPTPVHAAPRGSLSIAFESVDEEETAAVLLLAAEDYARGPTDCGTCRDKVLSAALRYGGVACGLGTERTEAADTVGQKGGGDGAADELGVRRVRGGDRTVHAGADRAEFDSGSGAWAVRSARAGSVSVLPGSASDVASREAGGSESGGGGAPASSVADGQGADRRRSADAQDFAAVAARFVRETESCAWEERSTRLALLLASVANEKRIEGRASVDADMAYRLRTAVGLLTDVDALSDRVSSFLDAEVSR